MSINLPAAVYQSAIDRVQVFVQGSDGHLYDNFWDGTQWVWEDHGTPPGTGVGVLDGTHAAVYQSAIDRVQVFVKGSDGHLYDNFWDGTQLVWEDHGTPF
jgi:uncharacterized protein YegJ (DUF2314 family)